MKSLFAGVILLALASQAHAEVYSCKVESSPTTEVRFSLNPDKIEIYNNAVIEQTLVGSFGDRECVGALLDEECTVEFVAESDIEATGGIRVRKPAGTSRFFLQLETGPIFGWCKEIQTTP